MITLLFISSIIRPYRKWYFILCLAPICSGITFAINNYAIKILIDTISGEIYNYSLFITPLLIFFVIEISIRLCWSLHDYAEYKIHGKVFRDLILKPYQYLQNHSYKYFQENFSGSISSKIKGISDGYYNFWDKISHSLLESIAAIIANIIMIGFLSMKLLLPVILFMLICAIICYFQSKVYDKMAFEIKQNWHKLLGNIADKITNIFTVFSFATRKRELRQIEDFYKKIQIPAVDKANYFNYISWLIAGILYSTMLLATFFYAIYLRKNGYISTGVLAVSISIILKLIHETFTLTQGMMSFIQNLADLRASLDGIFIKQEIIDKPDAKELIV